MMRSEIVRPHRSLLLSLFFFSTCRRFFSAVLVSIEAENLFSFFQNEFLFDFHFFLSERLPRK